MTEKPKPEASRITRLESIPVSLLKFRENDALELPGLGGSSSLKAITPEEAFDEKGKRKSGGKFWIVTFIPAIRHFRIVHYPHDGASQEVSTRMLWEGHVRNWESIE